MNDNQFETIEITGNDSESGICGPDGCLIADHQDNDNNSESQLNKNPGQLEKQLGFFFQLKISGDIVA